DHRKRRALLFGSHLSLGGEGRVKRLADRLDLFRRLIDARRGKTPRTPEVPVSVMRDRHRIDATSLRCTPSDERYLSAVAQVKEHIVAGDIFQANLSRRWSLDHGADSAQIVALDLYHALARRSPAPFAAYFDAGDHVIASSSPECFLEIREGEIESRPVKGTRPRGLTPDVDISFKAMLMLSPKDQAENVMIVDVVRNDLGRVCRTGTVKGTKLLNLETFAQVHHLVSTVRGQLLAHVDFVDVLRATFPGASITGAPKIRAM